MIECPWCGGASRTVDSRPRDVSGRPTVRRRRACQKCDNRWTTFEVLISNDLLANIDKPMDTLIKLSRLSKANRITLYRVLNALLEIQKTEEREKAA